ncbi:hypothetical protein SRABI106_04338 [Rahnella aquatilis]|nr:hypothetical protein SRABI106_04338 [Rahnella aquatilis]
MAVLTFTAGLTHKFPFDISHRFAHRFTVRYLRFADVGFHTELPFHTVDDDFQMQFAHTGNDRLAGFLIGADTERRVF